jgi:hypothetical protein
MKEVGVEDCRKIISNPVIKFSDSMNADETSMMTATMTIQKFCR